MAKLNELYRLVGNYLELYGDKEITSIGTHIQPSSNRILLNLHDTVTYIERA